ncbi:hypothetical protein LCGC14_0313340 [marine sediment metagenome]|uniref:Uncharacterized protein n=1 Tax=marine sediment metagenome TaxID=412755 RepID=A0A0F9U431_9ZZZZ
MMVENSTGYWEYRCFNCGNKFNHIYSLGPGTVIETKCDDCNTINHMDVSDTGALVLSVKADFPSTTSLGIRFSA